MEEGMGSSGQGIQFKGGSPSPSLGRNQNPDLSSKVSQKPSLCRDKAITIMNHELQ